MCKLRLPSFGLPPCCRESALSSGAASEALDAKGVQLEVPKLVRPTDSFDVHNPLMTSLRRPVRVSELVQRDFEELSAAECLSTPCPKPGLAPCGTAWQALMKSACVHSLRWSQEVRDANFCQIKVRRCSLFLQL